MSDDSIRQALADPITRARVNALISDFEDRGVALLPLNVIAALTDIPDLNPDDVALLAEAVLARVQDRPPVDSLKVELDGPKSAAAGGVY